MHNVELMELKAKLYYLKKEYMYGFDLWSDQENKYFLNDIRILQSKIKKLERKKKNEKK